MTVANLKLSDAVELASRKYEQLVFLPLGYISNQTVGLPGLNVGLAVAERLIEYAAPERPKFLASCLQELINEAEGSVLVLSRIEVLFESSLATDPLKLLKACSRQKTLLVEWPGYLSSSSLIYATPNHSDYREYRLADLKDVIVLSAN